MTGPPYPPPAATSPFDPWTTIISQYANSPVLDAMILAFNDAVDQTQNIDNFYDMVWNVETAEGYGLDVWGRIVGVSRTIQLPVLSGSQFFGFNEANSWLGWGGGGIFYGGGSVTQNVNLSDADFRQLILAKAASNISDSSIPSINNILLTLFAGRGNAYVIDGLNMTMVYRLEFTLTPVEQAIIAQQGVLPQPVGVAITISSGPPLGVQPETNPHFLGKFKMPAHKIPALLRMPHAWFEAPVPSTHQPMPLRSKGWNFVPLPGPRYLYGMGGSVGGSAASASTSFILPGPWRPFR